MVTNGVCFFKPQPLPFTIMTRSTLIVIIRFRFWILVALLPSYSSSFAVDCFELLARLAQEHDIPVITVDLASIPSVAPHGELSGGNQKGLHIVKIDREEILVKIVELDNPQIAEYYFGEAIRAKRASDRKWSPGFKGIVPLRGQRFGIATTYIKDAHLLTEYDAISQEPAKTAGMKMAAEIRTKVPKEVRLKWAENIRRIVAEANREKLRLADLHFLGRQDGEVYLIDHFLHSDWSEDPSKLNNEDADGIIRNLLELSSETTKGSNFLDPTKKYIEVIHSEPPLYRQKFTTPTDIVKARAVARQFLTTKEKLRSILGSYLDCRLREYPESFRNSVKSVIFNAEIVVNPTASGISGNTVAISHPPGASVSINTNPVLLDNVTFYGTLAHEAEHVVQILDEPHYQSEARLVHSLRTGDVDWEHKYLTEFGANRGAYEFYQFVPEAMIEQELTLYSRLNDDRRAEYANRLKAAQVNFTEYHSATDYRSPAAVEFFYTHFKKPPQEIQ
jgi:hypothetical protein